MKFQVKKKNVQEHFKLLLHKFKAKRKRIELTSKIEKSISLWWRYQINGRRQRPVTLVHSKEKADSDRAIGEEIGWKAC